MGKRKLEVQQLKIGMYVRELDRPWRETPFIFQGFEIRSEDEIRDLQRYCQHVYVDIPEVYQQPAPRTPAEKAVAEEVLQHRKVERDLLIKVASHPLLKPVYTIEPVWSRRSKPPEKFIMKPGSWYTPCWRMCASEKTSTVLAPKRWSPGWWKALSAIRMRSPASLS